MVREGRPPVAVALRQESELEGPAFLPPPVARALRAAAGPWKMPAIRLLLSVEREPPLRHLRLMRSAGRRRVSIFARAARALEPAAQAAVPLAAVQPQQEGPVSPAPPLAEAGE